jgi:aspartate/methionine/tyrosine aminotransferase
VVATTVPAYGLYQQQCKLLRGSFATFESLTAEGLHALFESENVGDRRIRTLVLCIPNNPTGNMITSTEAKSLCRALDEIYNKYYASDPVGGFSVILDEVYLGITAKPVHSLFNYASPRLRQSIFLILSCSKGLGAMPGARAAWITSKCY